MAQLGGTVRRRTKSRMLALMFCYQEDLQGKSCANEMQAFLHTFSIDEGVREYAAKMIEGMRLNLERLDAEIIAVSANWPINRMAPVDRAIIRLATYEMLFHRDTPPKVVINEAIELAKKFSTPESGAFVNGVLDKIREKNNIVIIKG